MSNPKSKKAKAQKALALGNDSKDEPASDDDPTEEENLLEKIDILENDLQNEIIDHEDTRAKLEETQRKFETYKSQIKKRRYPTLLSELIDYDVETLSDNERNTIMAMCRVAKDSLPQLSEQVDNEYHFVNPFPSTAHPRAVWANVFIELHDQIGKKAQEILQAFPGVYNDVSLQLNPTAQTVGMSSKGSSNTPTITQVVVASDHNMPTLSDTDTPHIRAFVDKLKPQHARGVKCIPGDLIVNQVAKKAL